MTELLILDSYTTLAQAIVMDMNIPLQQFIKTCSSNTLGEFQLSKMNDANNTQRDFQNEVQKLLEHVLKMVEFAEKWAETEAQARYVSYIRQGEGLRREDQVIEAKKLIVRKRKELRNTVLNK